MGILCLDFSGNSDTILTATLHFSGCSCGCTPSRSQTIESNNKFDLIKECVKWCLEYTCYGDSFKKRLKRVYIDSGDISLADCESLYNVCYAKYEQQRKLEGLLIDTFLPPYTAKPGYWLTKEQEDANVEAKATFLKEQEELKEKIKVISQDIEASLSNNCSVVEEYDAELDNSNG
jgi:hypothetical protein